MCIYDLTNCNNVSNGICVECIGGYVLNIHNLCVHFTQVDPHCLIWNDSLQKCEEFYLFGEDEICEHYLNVNP